MTDMTMVERVAAGQAEYDGRTLIGMSRGERERYYERARIAMAAMEEPTLRMVMQGQEAVYKGGARSGPVSVPMTTGSFSDIYRAMIQAALNEQG